MQVHLVIFYQAPQPFRTDVIVPATTAVHADVHRVGLEDRDEPDAGELCAMACGKNVRAAKARARFPPQWVDAEVRCERIGEPPGGVFAGKPVYDGREVLEAASHWDLRDLRRLGAVGPIDREAAQQVREDYMLGMRSSGVLAAADRLDSNAAHERRDMPPVGIATFEHEQVAQHPGASKRQFQMQLVDSTDRAQIRIRSRRRPLVHAGAQQPQQPGLSGDRQSMCEIHQRFPLDPSSSRNTAPKESISRACWPILACSSGRSMRRETDASFEIEGRNAWPQGVNPGIVRFIGRLQLYAKACPCRRRAPVNEWHQQYGRTVGVIHGVASVSCRRAGITGALGEYL